MQGVIKSRIIDSLRVKQTLLDDDRTPLQIKKAADYCVESLKGGNKILFCGNGGSAADAQHLAAELSGRYYFDRPPLAAEALHVNSSYLTAVANDYSYDVIYSRLIESQGKPGDVLFAISTSGKSKNIIKAVELAKSKEVKVVSMTGERKSVLSEMSDLCFQVPSNDTPRIQEAHIMIGHIICELIEASMFKKN